METRAKYKFLFFPKKINGKFHWLKLVISIHKKIKVKELDLCNYTGEVVGEFLTDKWIEIGEFV